MDFDQCRIGGSSCQGAVSIVPETERNSPKRDPSRQHHTLELKFYSTITTAQIQYPDAPLDVLVEEENGITYGFMKAVPPTLSDYGYLTVDVRMGTVSRSNHDLS
jgi:hypothetical protein